MPISRRRKATPGNSYAQHSYLWLMSLPVPGAWQTLRQQAQSIYDELCLLLWRLNLLITSHSFMMTLKMEIPSAAIVLQCGQSGECRRPSTRAMVYIHWLVWFSGKFLIKALMGSQPFAWLISLIEPLSF